MANIRDVAKKAGVSVATVSRVLNQNGYVKESTAEKVRQVIEELNYKRDAIAMGLSNKRTNTLGLILPDITNPFFPALAKAVGEAARKKGYTMILCNSDGEIESELEHIEMLESKYVAGIILVSNSFKVEHYRESKTPIVLVDRMIDGSFSTVTSNNYEGGRLATQHLLEVGCKKIAHIAGPQDVLTAQQRLEGYKDIVKALPWFSDDLIISSNYNLDDAFKATKKLLQTHDGIDGIFAGNDLMAIGSLKAIHSLGLYVPKDIALIGFDGISITELVIPELSTISQPVYEMGSTAVEMIFAVINNENKETLIKELDVQLIKRESTNRS